MSKKLDIPIALPFMGEFGGGVLLNHAPGIYGYEGDLIVCHERGYEALYPKCIDRYVYDRPPASERRAGGNIYQQHTKGFDIGDRVPYFDQIKERFGQGRRYVSPTEPFKWKKEWFVPEHSGQYDLDFDVLLFARCQQYAAARNFPFWSEWYAVLKAEGIRCLVAGHPDSTAKLDCPGVWDLVDEPHQILDATIWAIKAAKMRIGTPTGTTLLSVMCGKPVIMLIAETGHCVQGDKMSFPAGYYYQMDHLRQGYRVIAHWMEWEKGVQEFLDWYRDIDRFNRDCRDWIKKIHKNLEIPDPDKRWRKF